MLTEFRNDGITDMLKTVYPTKTLFCWGNNKVEARKPQQYDICAQGKQINLGITLVKSVFAVHFIGNQAPLASSGRQWRLIRLGRCLKIC